MQKTADFRIISFPAHKSKELPHTFYYHVCEPFHNPRRHACSAYYVYSEPLISSFKYFTASRLFPVPSLSVTGITYF
jgi:hypothetical protein